MSKPTGKVRMVSSEMRRPANDKAVFVNILCEDEAGAPFYFSTAAFGFDLKPGFPPPGDRPAQETRLCRKCESPLPEHWSFSFCNVCCDQV